MTSRDDGAGRQLLPPPRDTSQLRVALFNLYGWDPRYRKIVVELLRPAWRNFSGDAEGEGWWYDFDEVFRRVVTDAAHSPELSEYLDTLRFTVKEHLGLVKDGGAPDWACALVHGVVAPPPWAFRATPPLLRDESVLEMGGITWRDPYQPPPADLPPGFKSFSAQLSILVSPLAATISLNGDPPSNWQWVFGPEWMTFNDWEKLGQEAQAALDRALAQLQADYRRYYEAVPEQASWFRNRKTVLQDRNFLVPILFRHLFHEEALPPGLIRKRLVRLASRIGIDLPR